MEGQTLFETDRLIARCLLKEDAPAMHRIYGDAESMRYVGEGDTLLEEHCLHRVGVADQNLLNIAQYMQHILHAKFKIPGTPKNRFVSILAAARGRASDTLPRRQNKQ